MVQLKGFLAWPGAPLAVASAALFGASTPLAKTLLGEGVSPWLLAALLYLGSGLGLASLHYGRKVVGAPSQEAPLARADWGWMALVVLAGGVAGPVLLMLGLATTSAASAALLLNLEGLATMAIAWMVFRENVDRRLLLGAAAILAGALLLSWQEGAGLGGFGAGSVFIAAACLAWGVDNNLTRRISASDPVQIAMVKGLVAGAVNLAVALSAGARPPDAGLLAAAGLVGFLGYGVSLVLFVLALRFLGTARTGAYFSAAPFIGALLALLLFAEPVTWRLAAAAVLMGVGLYLHLVERHEHGHEHSPLEHEHPHRHDAHHQHAHGPGDPSGEPHTHSHRHARLRHAHPHYPDLHHRHDH
ncbi:MAG: DMT family transporter [Phenylobacterium sp.]|uniref:DMT family transporter n=1 Tax=Phenylobacterium sp. TaxID=1871053 RepID=UPI0011FDBD36|nr:DMT family transporter [Phenylobacterium sp.]TAL36232.1 MAG: DMT family transporter [Phenylobacterium sp.]